MSDEMNKNPESLEPEDDVNALSEGDLIEMIGDDGETVSFIFVDALEYEGDVYLALAEPEEDDGEYLDYSLRRDEDEEDITLFDLYGEDE